MSLRHFIEGSDLNNDNNLILKEDIARVLYKLLYNQEETQKQIKSLQKSQAISTSRLSQIENIVSKWRQY